MIAGFFSIAGDGRGERRIGNRIHRLWQRKVLTAKPFLHRDGCFGIAFSFCNCATHREVVFILVDRRSVRMAISALARTI